MRQATSAERGGTRFRPATRVEAGAIALALAWMLTTSIAGADNDPNRDVACVSRQIGVTEDQFRTCFLPVEPDPAHDPDGETQRANKAKLLPCLQAANPALTNGALDQAMDACRPEGPN